MESPAKQLQKPKVHSSWAKLRRAFLATSSQQQQKQQHKLPGPQICLRTIGLTNSSRKAKRDRAVGDLSPTALRYRKFVKGLKSSFTFSTKKSRQQALGELASPHQVATSVIDCIQRRSDFTAVSAHMKPSEPVSSCIPCNGVLTDKALAPACVLGPPHECNHQTLSNICMDISNGHWLSVLMLVQRRASRACSGRRPASSPGAASCSQPRAQDPRALLTAPLQRSTYPLRSTPHGASKVSKAPVRR